MYWIKFLTQSPDGLLWAKGDQESNRTNIQQGQQHAQQQYGQFQNYLQGNQKGLDEAGAEERGYLTSGLRNMASTGGITPEQEAALRATTTGASGGGGGGSGGGAAADHGRFNEPWQGYSNFASTGGIDLSNIIKGYQGFQGASGGFDANTLATLKGYGSQLGDISRSAPVSGTIARLNDFSNNAGVSQDDLSQIRRPLFQEMEQTGGFNPQEVSDIRARSNSVIPSYYQNLQDTMNRSRAISGGYSPGFDAASRAAARQGAQQAGDQSRNTELDISSQIRQNKMAAAQQMAANQLALTGITTPAKLGALQASGSLGLGMYGAQNSALMNAGTMGIDIQKQIDAMRMAGFSNEQGARESVRQGQLAGLGGMTSIGASLTQADIAAAGRAAAQAMQNQALSAANERFLIGSHQQGSEAGYGDLLRLYGTNYAPGYQNQQLYLNSLNSGNNANLGYLGALNQNANQPGQYGQGFNNFFHGLGTVAPLLKGLGGGNGDDNTDVPPEYRNISGDFYSDPGANS